MSRNGGASPILKGIVNLRTSGIYPDNTRLPDNVTPVSYKLDLITVLDPDFINDGYFEMEASVEFGSAAIGKISVHFKDMSFDESSMTLRNLNDNSLLDIQEHVFDFERDSYSLTYANPSSSTYNVLMSGKFLGEIGTANGIGYYRDSYIDVLTGETRWMAVTQFETNDARRAFPCIDEPNKKAIYEVRLGHATGTVAQSNMPIVKSGDPVDGYPGYFWDQYDKTFPISSYLIAFAVSDFESSEATPLPNGVKHITWARSDAISDGLAEYVKSVAPEIVQGYEELFSVSFYLPKLEQISPRHKGGAMENWGLITYSETGLLLDPAISGANWDESMVSVQAHEIAHHWFGDLVTCDWWSYIWLNEGFATYISYYGSESVSPYFENFKLFVYSDMNKAFQADEDASSHEISQEVEWAEVANFGSITYSKGGSLIRMVENFITQASWTKGLTNYLNANAFGAAIPDSLFYYWDEAAKEDGTLSDSLSVKTIMDTWTLQKNYPLVTVTRSYATGEATLTQERFLMKPDETGDTNDYKWWIPVTFSSVGDGESDFDNTYNDNMFLRPEDDSLVVNTGVTEAGIIFNVQFASFYRTNYDDDNWQRIAETLSNDHTRIHPNNRAQLITDSFEIARAGYLPDYSTASAIAAYLAAETEYVVWAYARNNALDLNSNINSAPGGQALLDSLIASFFAKFNELGIDEIQDSTWNDQMAQRMVIKLACDFDQPECVSAAQASFSAWMSTPDPDDLASNPTNRHARSDIYCTAVRYGGQAEIDFLEERMAGTTYRNPQERSNIATGLGCSSNVKTVLRTLNEFVSNAGDFYHDDLVSVLAGNPKTSEALRELYFGNQEQLTKQHFSTTVVDLFADVLSLKNTQHDLKMAEDLITLTKEHTGKYSRTQIKARQEIIDKL